MGIIILVQAHQARILEAAVVHLSLLKPLPLLRKASRPHAEVLILPISASTRPTSLPQAYPALKLTAEKTMTIPADIIHDMTVGEMARSWSGALFLDALLLAFFTCRSLPVSLAFRFTKAGSAGDDTFLPSDLRLPEVWDGDVGTSPLSSDSGTSLKVIGVLRVFCWMSGAVERSPAFGLLRTAAAQDKSVVNEARRAASWSCRPVVRSFPFEPTEVLFEGNDLGKDTR